MENYKEKYEKALKVASQWHKDGIGDVKTIVECIFPELSESEDERIRKEMIDRFKSLKPNFSWYEVPIDNILAWLEKQGEHNLSWCEDDENMREAVIDVLVNNTMSGSEGDKVYSEEIDWLKSLKPNHWKPSEEQMETLKFAANDYCMGETKKNLESLYNDLKKL